MPEIGTTLREARMRARIDISEIETETKIRAKYLRALENEEWDLLPGPTYVKSFLRTYADALDLDSKLLLEEYKLRHERPSDHDLMPIAPPRRQQGRPSRGVPRVLLVAVVFLALLGALWALGRSGGGNDRGGASTIAQPAATTTTTTTTPRAASPATGDASSPKRRASSRLVRLQVQATGPVFVCLEAAGGRRPINGVNLQPGSSQEFRSSRFRLTLGNGNARLRINGKLRNVPSVSNGIGFEITKSRVRRLSPKQRPACARA
jgi:hypothetical protein